MEIGVDGAALSQGLLAGIYNVTVQLLAAMADQRPQHNFTVFVPSNDFADPAGLFSRPNVRILTWHGLGVRRLLSESLTVSSEAAPYLLINGVRRVTPVSDTHRSLTFVVDQPCRTLVLASRTMRPSDETGSSDTRRLGLGIFGLHFKGPLGGVSVAHDDPRLSAGFHFPEVAHRWTNGAAVIPRALFARCGTPLTVVIDVECMTGKYFVDDQPMVEAARSLYGSLDALSMKVEERFAERALRGMDVFHSHHFAPRIVPGAINIATAYDIIPVLHPEHFGADAVAHFRNVLGVFRQADRVLCISEATRRDLITHLNFPPEKVFAVPIDCDAVFRPLARRELKQTLERFGLEGRPYIICVGTLEPRKGHTHVVEAFTRLRQSCPELQPRLAIVGKRGWSFEKVFAAIESSPFREDIVHLGDVGIDELVRLYNGAHFAAYLSSYEGFGLPVLEAIACGVPVVTSNVSSMPEVAGPAGLLVRPDNSEEAAEAFRRMFTEPSLRDSLASFARDQRALFSWSKAAAVYLQHVEDLIGRTRGAA